MGTDDVQGAGGGSDQVGPGERWRWGWGVLYSPCALPLSFPTQSKASLASYTWPCLHCLPPRLPQRDAAQEELRRVGQRLSAAEQLVRAKEVEVEDLRRAYEALALDHRR